MGKALFAAAGVMGFLTARFLSGKTEGQQGKVKSVRIRSGDSIVHIHHWLYGAAALGSLLALGSRNRVVMGFLAGVIAQGLTYKDFHKIVYKA